MGRDHPIRVGSILVTMVEPRRGHEVEYNRWYERDHFYAGCMIGPGCFAGDRFVATRDLKALRYPAVSDITPSPEVGSYLALYWILEGMHDEWNRWAVDQVNALHAAGRMFTERDHIHTLLYRYAFDEVRDPDGVSLPLALDHAFGGLAMTVADATGSRDDLVGWYREHLAGGGLAAAGAQVAGGFTPLPLLVDAPGDVPRHERADDRVMVLWFLDGDPAEAWSGALADHGALLEKSGVGTLVWASPFRPTVTGTDTYTDQLW